MSHPEASEKQLAAAALPGAGPRVAPNTASSAPDAERVPGTHGFTSPLYGIAGLKAGFVSRTAPAPQALLRVPRREAGLFSCGVNPALDENRTFSPRLADGFIRTVRADPGYRRAIAEFEPTRSLRAELPNHVVLQPAPAAPAPSRPLSTSRSPAAIPIVPSPARSTRPLPLLPRPRSARPPLTWLLPW